MSKQHIKPCSRFLEVHHHYPPGFLVTDAPAGPSLHFPPLYPPMPTYSIPLPVPHVEPGRRPITPNFITTCIKSTGREPPKEFAHSRHYDPASANQFTHPVLCSGVSSSHMKPHIPNRTLDPASRHRPTYPGHSVRPLSEIWPSVAATSTFMGTAGCQDPHPVSKAQLHAHNQLLTNHTSTRVIQSSPNAPKRSVAHRILGDFPPWTHMRDLQGQIRSVKNPDCFIPDPRAPLYLAMNQGWELVLSFLSRETLGKGSLDTEHINVFLKCFADLHPLNHPNIRIAMRCLELLTSSQKQRDSIQDDQLFHGLIKLSPSLAAASSRLVGVGLTMNVLRVLVALFEDNRLQDRLKLSQELRDHVAEKISRVWISWHKDENVVQLARRALVTINPHYDTDEEDLNDTSEAAESTPPNSRNADSTQDTNKPVSEACKETDVIAPVESNLYRARNTCPKTPSSLVLTSDMKVPVFEERRCAYFPHCTRAAKECHGWSMGSCTMIYLTEKQEEELREWKRQKNHKRKAAKEAKRRVEINKKRCTDKEDSENQTNV